MENDWQFAGSSREGEAFEIRGTNVWDQGWQVCPGRRRMSTILSTDRVIFSACLPSRMKQRGSNLQPGNSQKENGAFIRENE